MSSPIRTPELQLQYSDPGCWSGREAPWRRYAELRRGLKLRYLVEKFYPEKYRLTRAAAPS